MPNKGSNNGKQRPHYFALKHGEAVDVKGLEHKLDQTPRTVPHGDKKHQQRTQTPAPAGRDLQSVFSAFGQTKDVKSSPRKHSKPVGP